MWLVLCEQGDSDARWAHQRLAARGLQPVELVTGAALVTARRWEHRLGADGVSVSIELSDGRIIRSGELQGVLNRLIDLPEDLLGYGPPDREYATQELYAFFLSWLTALPCRVLNRPSPYGLSGTWLDRSQWLMLAARAALPTPMYSTSSAGGDDGPLMPGVVSDRGRKSVVVVGDRALGSAGSQAVAAGCGRLAGLVGATVLGVEFVVDSEDRWLFASASVTPRLRRGGDRMLDLVVAALQAPP